MAVPREEGGEDRKRSAKKKGGGESGMGVKGGGEGGREDSRMNGTSGSPDHYGEGGHTEVSHRAATAPEVDPNAVDIGDGARGAGGGQATESVFCCWPRPQPKAGEDGAITVSKPAE